MDTEMLLEQARQCIASMAEKFVVPEAGRLDAYLPVTQLVEATRAMIKMDGWYLSAITGLDMPAGEASDGVIELLYQFCNRAAVFTLRVQAPYGLPEVPSVCPVIPSATLYERELIEMFGVIFTGTPNKDRLLLPDDWPDNVYPLRKSFTGLEEGE